MLDSRGSELGQVDGRLWFFFFQAEDGIRDLVRSRGLGDVYKRQTYKNALRYSPVLDRRTINVILVKVREGENTSQVARRIALHLSLIHI